MSKTSGKWVIGVSGASGMRYAIALMKELAQHADVSAIDVIMSEAALRVLHEEENIKLSYSSLNSENLLGIKSDKIKFSNPRDIGASCASGSNIFDGMVVVPCSMSSLGAIANGVPQNLLHRAADVTIKENRKLILVPRETPVSAIHLENMLKLSRLGIVMLPAMPGFYHKPKKIDDLIDMLVMKIMDSMGLENNIVKRWE